MKKILLALFISGFCFAQEMPKITKEGFSPIVVGRSGKKNGFKRITKILLKF